MELISQFWHLWLILTVVFGACTLLIENRRLEKVRMLARSGDYVSAILATFSGRELMVIAGFLTVIFGVLFLASLFYRFVI